MTALVISFPQERIVRDRQAQIDMRKGFQLLRRRYPKKTPAEWWEGAACGMAIKAIWDKAAQERAANLKSPGISDDRLVELAGKAMQHSHELRQEAADKVLARPGVRERFAAKLAELDARGTDQPPPTAA